MKVGVGRVCVCVCVHVSRKHSAIRAVALFGCATTTNGLFMAAAGSHIKQYTCTQTRQPKTYFIRSILFSTSKTPGSGRMYVCANGRQQSRSTTSKWNGTKFHKCEPSCRLESNSPRTVCNAIDAQNIASFHQAELTVFAAMRNRMSNASFSQCVGRPSTGTKEEIISFHVPSVWYVPSASAGWKSILVARRETVYFTLQRNERKAQMKCSSLRLFLQQMCAIVTWHRLWQQCNAQIRFENKNRLDLRKRSASVPHQIWKFGETSLKWHITRHTHAHTYRRYSWVWRCASSVHTFSFTFLVTRTQNGK